MRTIVSLAGVAGVIALAACSSKDSSMNSELRKDLELASTASPIELPVVQPASQVVSAIERTAPPAPRKVAQSQRVAKHKAAPRGILKPVEVSRPEVAVAIEPEPAAPAPAPAEVSPLPSQRPRPVASSGGGGYGDGSMGDGRGDRGAGIGSIISVVLRGGVVDGDECDPRTDGRRRGGVNTAVNNRIPVIGTFPGSGRVGGAVAVGGMILGRGRSRF